MKLGFLLTFSLFSCRPPRNLDSRAFITIGDKVRVSVVYFSLASNSVCPLYGEFYGSCLTPCQTRSRDFGAPPEKDGAVLVQPCGMPLCRVETSHSGTFPLWSSGVSVYFEQLGS